jgi:hypothetical protein
MAKAQTGKWAFLLGLAVAVIAAFVAFAPWDGVLLLVLGAMNVSDKDATAFLVAALGLSLGAGAIGAVSILGVQVAGWVAAIVGNLVALAGAAALVVAGKALYALAKE